MKRKKENKITNTNKNRMRKRKINFLKNRKG